MKALLNLLTLGLLSLGLTTSTLLAAEKKLSPTAQAIIALEHEFAAAYCKDVATVERIMADDYVFISPEGEYRTKADEIGDLKSGKLKVTQLTAEDMKVRVHGTAAIVTGYYTVKGTMDGKDISGRFRFTDVFFRRKGVWQIVSTHACNPKP